MKGWNMFAEIKQYKLKGFNKSQVSRFLNINYKTVDKYWDMSYEEYAKLKDDAKNKSKRVDKYKELILSWIKEFRVLKYLIGLKKGMVKWILVIEH